MRLLRQLIGTVGEGDPFIFENAVRLRKMGWIAVIVELTKIPAGAMAIFLVGQFETDRMQLDIDFSLTGILLALVLFILARVFRHGAAMREDLRSEEHTSELQSLMRISYAVFCLKKKKTTLAQR